MEPLFHFSTEEIRSVHSVKQGGDEARPDKPNGFWVSVEGNGDGWSDWCRAEQYGIGPIPHVVALAPLARILRIASVAELDDFTEAYRDRSAPKIMADHSIDWHAIGGLYQGIIITPYLWERRLTRHTSWYYGWDCASGCIWDADAVEEIMPVSIRSAA